MAVATHPCALVWSVYQRTSGMTGRSRSTRGTVIPPELVYVPYFY